MEGRPEVGAVAQFVECSPSMCAALVQSSAPQWVWWFAPVIQAPGKWMQEDQGLRPFSAMKAILEYMTSCLKKLQ